MKANELRIGNYAQDQNGNLLQVIELCIYPESKQKEEKVVFSVVNRETYPLKDGWKAEFIPLTGEWLLKFGFEKVADKIADHFNIGFYHYENKDCWIYLLKEGFELELITLDERHNLARVYKYVHQLQNLYFALTGKELIFKP